ncbi:MAG TPA: GMC family oxidoreductase N-terminal domain-containing protein [Steroidobacteraceae bacterium]
MASQEDSFDYVIVGAGTAGCVLANRLSADPGVRMCLLEAGPADRSFAIRIPAAVAVAIGDRRIAWGYRSAPQSELNGREVVLPRGRVLGGCSSINGMVYFRGHPRDFDDWAALGASGWSYQDVLPYFLRSENNEAWPDSPIHGHGGPMNVIDIAQPNPLIAHFLEAMGSLGYRRNNDFSGADPEGYGPRQATIRGGLRESMVSAYLRPARDRGNLRVLTGALVTRIVIEGRRATGVIIERGGSTQRLLARREVIVSAGSYASPQVLMLSGIGEARALQGFGIEVKHDLPGVGADLQDHPAIAVQMKTRDARSYGLSAKALPRDLWNILEYALLRRGPLASNMFEATAFVRSSERKERPDLQLVFMPAHRNTSGFPIPIGHGYGIIAIAVRPKSRGRVTLASPDPHVAPRIDPHYLQDPDDLRTLLQGALLARRILGAPAFEPLAATEILPGRHVREERDWIEYIRGGVVSVHHPTSTCRAGVDPLAVVDPQLRVRGLEGLRVADASVFPQGVAGNCNAAVVMVAEKASDLILATPPTPA